MGKNHPNAVRYIDEDTEHEKLYEILLNTVQDRNFFTPSKLVNLIIIGVLAYAQKATGLKICYVNFMSNHAHILVRSRFAKQVADFFCLANSQICKELEHIFQSWTGSIFTPGYTLIAVTDEPEAQEARLRYLMSQGTKEGLCPGPTFWPGVHAASALIGGTMSLKGQWIHRTNLYDKQRLYERTRALKAANRKRNKARSLLQRKSYRGKRNLRPRIKQHTETLFLELSPIPCWDDLSTNERKRRARKMERSIVDEHKDKIRRLPPNWKARLQDTSRYSKRPRRPRPPSVQPKVHAASREAWIDWMENWRGWYRLYARASERLRSGIPGAMNEFPPGSFVPSGLYVPKLNEELPV